MQAVTIAGRKKNQFPGCGNGRSDDDSLRLPRAAIPAKRVPLTLGRDCYLLPIFFGRILQKLSNDPFGFAVAIDLGRIVERKTELFTRLPCLLEVLIVSGFLVIPYVLNKEETSGSAGEGEGIPLAYLVSPGPSTYRGLNK